jgi:hypothetical protein
MKLLELEPKWLSPDVFSFKCPHCRETLLLCKRIELSFKDQVKLVNPTPEDDEDWPARFVPMKTECAWSITGDFTSMTVTPSIDASASGHWHGHITNGEIVGGL